MTGPASPVPWASQAATVTAPAERVPAFQTALAANEPYLLDVRCDRACPTPVTPYNQAKHEWVDND